ncbi:MAG TPA: hypothetical protein VGC54_09460 [Planctomycetota bacterium]
MRFAAYLVPISLFLALAMGPPASAVAQQPGDRTRNCARERSDCMQECFDAFIDNEQACIDVWCDRFLFLRWCDADELRDCVDRADQTWEACREACEESYLRCIGVS